MGTQFEMENTKKRVYSTPKIFFVLSCTFSTKKRNFLAIGEGLREFYRNLSELRRVKVRCFGAPFLLLGVPLFRRFLTRKSDVILDFISSGHLLVVGELVFDFLRKKG